MTQYEALAARLAEIEKAIHFYRENAEFPTFFQALGPVDGKRVLDLGCGDGTYARMVAQRGAEHVVGMDSSREMIQLAEIAEAEQPLGIRYHIHDLATMPTLGTFDLVIAVNVLHYAGSRANLDDMCRRISSNLAPGGRLLAYVGNTEVDSDAARNFGFLVDRPTDAREGDVFTVTIAATPPASIEVHYWPAASVVQALESAGLTGVRWEEMTHPPLPPDSADRLGRLLKNPPSRLLSAFKE